MRKHQADDKYLVYLCKHLYMDWLIGSNIVRFPDPHYVVVEPDQLKHSSLILSFKFF